MICTECIQTETIDNSSQNNINNYHISVPKSLVLRLRGSSIKSFKSIKWDSSVIDNEFLNKKKSKCCCVYCPKKKNFLGKDN